MPGLCGTMLASTGAAAAPACVGEAMARAALPFWPRRRTAASDRAFLCLWPDTPAADILSNDEVICAIAGDPRWSDPELADLAAQRGHATALAESYRRHGTGLFDHLQGAFSLALADRATGRALVAIDRMGIHPMCVARDRAGGFVFGSTADLVIAHGGVDDAISPQAVFDFLFLAISPAPGSIYRAVTKLLPGEAAVFENDTLRTLPYWRFPDAEEDERNGAALATALHDVLAAAVRRAVEGEPADRIGAFLSGGLDSTTVCGLLREATGTAPKSFTIGFTSERYDETPFARASAAHFGAEHVVRCLAPADALDIVPRIAEAFDEPFGNSSVIPVYLAAKVARENGIDLMLAGDGGDELFGGNERYVSYGIYESYLRLPCALRRRFIEPVVAAMPGKSVMPVRKAANFLRTAKIPLPRRLVMHHLLATVPPNEVFAPDWLDQIDSSHPATLMEEGFHAAPSGSLIRRMMHLDLRLTLADNDLRKVGRACELAGVRVRYPFLDDEAVAFSARIPGSLLCPKGRLRDFYKRALNSFLPPATLAKRKHGFGMPFCEWSHADPGLRELIADCLTGMRRRGLLDPGFLDRVEADCAAGRNTGFGGIAWDIMMLELWFRRPVRGR